ncbi:MAG: hypothetical protein HGJ93_00660 [Desulfosarcina sp.]|nr:hypothetical protein [Desulfosarcina sp.]MBC2764497.1 hypothetical protein [Desulfosarcina sp.]
MTGQSKSSRQLRADQFKKDPFWKKDFLPTMHAMFAECMNELRGCPLEQVEGVRAQMDILERLERLPDFIIQQEADDLEFHTAQKALEEGEDEETISAAQREEKS